MLQYNHVGVMITKSLLKERRVKCFGKNFVASFIKR